MFHSALIRCRTSLTDPVDSGAVAEALLFYKHVHVAADRGLLGNLITTIGPDSLCELLSSGHITLNYSRHQPAIIAKTENYVPVYNVGSFMVSADQNKRRFSKEGDLCQLVDRVVASKERKKLKTILLEKTSFVNNTKLDKAKAAAITESQILDEQHLREAVRTLLENLVPNCRLPENWTFKALPADGGGFYIITDLDLVAMNKEYHKSVSPEHSSITPEYILSHVVEATLEAELAARYMSELVTNKEISDIIRVRLSSILQRRERSVADIGLFQEVLLGEAHALREAITSGSRTFSDFLPVLERAARFKQWAADINPDEKLIKEYYASITKDSWISKLPTKLVRYLLTSAAGFALGAVPGLAMGALDTFLVDRIFRGWRPNHFVEGPLKRFTSIE